MPEAVPNPTEAAPAPPNAEAETAVRAAAKAADDKHGQDILALHVRDLTSLADFFLLATANSTAQARAIYEAIDMAMSGLGREPLHVEGRGEYRWILMDYADVVVHIFLTDEREFYGLERLWGDAPHLDLTH